MSIPKELENKILRYHFVEHWPVGTIAVQLGVHHTTVDRVLSQAGLPKVERTRRASITDPYLPFIVETLQQYPTLHASRLYAMAKERGYPGGSSQFRHRVSELRPRKLPEAYLRLKTLPGEQGQMDWGAFGHVQIGRARRALNAFVLVLSWSRQIFLHFYLNQQMENFLRGHVAAFEAWQGLPKIILFDNLKSAVLERRGDAIRFNPNLLALAAHYRFELRPVAIARGNEKGRVERSIQYIRTNFFAGRTWTDIDDLNAQAQAWCLGVSADRRCPEDTTMTVREAFALEQPHLLSLPVNPFPTDECVDVAAGKTPYVRFDLNDYSIPHTHVQRTLQVVASLSTVRVCQDENVIAEHPRHYGKGEQIEIPAHSETLAEWKRDARHHRGQDRLAHAAPSSRELLMQAAARGNNLGTIVAALLRQLEAYGAAELEAAIQIALQRGVPHPNAVRLALEHRREERQQPPPIAVTLTDHPKTRHLVVRPASLARYDQLSESTADTQTNPPIVNNPIAEGKTHDE